MVNVLAREGEYWTVVFEGRVSRLRDAKGLRYLDHLLRHPGEEFHSLALMAGVDSAAPAPGASGAARDDGLSPGDLSDAGTVLDSRAMSAYRERVRDLQEELDDAALAHDVARAERAQEELDALMEQLSGGLGLGGRYRR